jgi:hypothetical protein
MVPTFPPKWSESRRPNGRHGSPATQHDFIGALKPLLPHPAPAMTGRRGAV